MQRTPMIPALVAIAIGLSSMAAAAERTRIVLTKNWHVKQLDTAEPDVAALSREAASPGKTWLAARMPAQVHDILLQHGKISDPRVGKNATESAWVGERDWAYACTFDSPKPHGGPVLLRFDGLDTLAAAYLNGRRIGRFNNMYRTYAVDVTDSLSDVGEKNVLLIVFESPLRFINQVEKSAGHEGVSKAHYLRKCHSDFGSYLGARPHSVKVGPFRDVWLDLTGPARIEDVWVRTELSNEFKSATIRARIEATGDNVSVRFELNDPDGRKVAQGTVASSGNTIDLAIGFDEPRLWWPRTHGSRPLYELNLELLYDGQCVDRRKLKVGIRDVRPVLTDPVTGEKRFRFDVNGQPIFLRGADWAPLEGMTHCWDQRRAVKLLELMELGRMNVLRIWGEGHIPPQEFYDECDRRGILIWQDFMFGYGMHPTGDPKFDENCRLEIEQTIRRLRNHPCLLLWVGGNENHMGHDFRYGTGSPLANRLFHKIMPEAVAQLDPGRMFHPSSPYGGRVPNWPLEGDWHDYSTLKFCPEASVPLYASEVGRASAPSLTSMRRFLSDEELWPEGYDPAVRTPGKPAWPPMWQYRSVGGSWDKVGDVGRYCDPTTAADLIRVLGTAHGQYLRDRVERERRGVPDGAPDGNRRCWGNMVWRLNDSWPILYWSVIDYYLEPKIAYYFLRRAYDPVLVSFERTDDQIAVWVTNDSPEPVAGTLTVARRRFSGETRGQLQAEVSLEPGQAKRCLTTDDFGPIYLRNEFLQASFAGREVTYLLTAERYLHLPEARLTARLVDDKIEIATDVFAAQVTLEMEGKTGAVFEDNFFDMPPGQKRTIAVVNAAGGKQLVVRSLRGEVVRLTIE
ncbi:MAG: glycoside hydrolase family 2 protein [Thermoguttaceae bacterium]